jgi:lipopolysaccharide assembly protein A
MQLMLIAGIVFAIGAVVFALQNNSAVVVTLALWNFEGSLAVVLLVAVGIGVLIAGLVSTPAVIRGQWATSRLRRQVAELERAAAEQQARNEVLAAEIEKLTPPAVTAAAPEAPQPKPYVGLRSLLAGEEQSTPPAG